MIVVGAVFLLWERLRPLDAPDASHSEEEDTEHGPA